MARGLPYDSDEGRAYAAAITAIMTGRAYRKSAEVAKRMGPHAGLRRERGSHARRDLEAPSGSREHPAHRLRAGRHAVGRAQGLGRRARPGRGGGLPECAGNRARPHRHDQLHDGLRHDGRRARLLARQVEEARRRRRAHDRQQDGADGARGARLRDPRGRGDRRVHRRAWQRDRCASPQARALSRVRLRDRRARDPLHGSREDDGRGAAVHLRCDLEDGQPARGDVGRRGRRSSWSRPGSWASRRSRSTATTARWRSRSPARRTHRRRASSPRSTRSAASSQHRSAAGCRTTAPRSAASSRSASTRATSTSACSKTGRRATSSWTSRRRARRSPG